MFAFSSFLLKKARNFFCLSFSFSFFMTRLILQIVLQSLRFRATERTSNILPCHPRPAGYHRIDTTVLDKALNTRCGRKAVGWQTVGGSGV